MLVEGEWTFPAAREREKSEIASLGQLHQLPTHLVPQKTQPTLAQPHNSKRGEADSGVQPNPC